MNRFTRAYTAFIKQAPVSYASKQMGGVQGAIAPTRSLEQFIRAYSEVPWLYSAVSLRATSVAQVRWKVLSVDKKGDTSEVEGNHELKELLDHPNSFQTGHELMYLTQVYRDLTGECYWIKASNGGRKELWIAPPQYMKVVPDAKNYIKGYVFERGGDIEPVPFSVKEVIPFITPNPANPLRGVGPAQAVGVDLDTENFSAQYNRNFFYNGAAPGLIITYPDTIAEPEYNRLMDKYNAEHRGYGRAHKMMVLTGGGSVTDVSASRRDMQFDALRKFNRDIILATLQVPYSLLGGSEHVNRATAEAELVQFARWVVVPQCVGIREKLNEFLCPDFGENIELDFEDPSPENTDQNAAVAEKLFKAGIITRNEARIINSFDEDPTEAGDEYAPAPQSMGFGGVAPTPEDGK